MKAKDLDKIFDAGKNKEARRLGVPRQSLIKVWVAEHLQISKTFKEKKSNQAA